MYLYVYIYVYIYIDTNITCVYDMLYKRVYICILTLTCKRLGIRETRAMRASDRLLLRELRGGPEQSGS